MRVTTFVLFVLSGTSCYAQQDPTVICMKNLAGNERFSPIENKLAIVEGRDTTFAMLANETLANKKEQQAIAEWVTARKECVKAGDAFHQQSYPPQIVAIVNEAENSIDAIAADLYNRKLTYGKFNKGRQNIMGDMMNKVAAVIQQIKNQREAQQQADQQTKKQDEQHAQDAAVAAQQRAAVERARYEAAQRAQQAQEEQNDLARRQAAAQILLNNMNNMRPYQLPMPPAPRPSVNTNCTLLGNQMNCTSH